MKLKVQKDTALSHTHFLVKKPETFLPYYALAYDFYEPLLMRIALGFGFTNNEASSLVQKVLAAVKSKCVLKMHMGNRRICLAKEMVRLCIHSISSSYFGQSLGEGNNLMLGNMPISYGAAYLLHKHLKFTEAETAELLNTTTIIIRERLHKAASFHQQV